MNFIDIVALIALGYGAWKGFRNGMIIEITSLVGLVIGVWAGLRLAFIFANYYRDNFDLPENWIPLLAFLTAFLLGMIAVYLLGRVVSGMVNSVGIGLPNKLGGAVFGGAKWLFLIGTLITIIGESKVIPESTKEESTAYPILEEYCTKVQEYSVGMLPKVGNVFDDVEGYFVDLDSVRQANGGIPPADSSATP